MVENKYNFPLEFKTEILFISILILLILAKPRYNAAVEALWQGNTEFTLNFLNVSIIYSLKRQILIIPILLSRLSIDYE